MDQNETRLMLIIAAGMFSFLAGIVGLAFVSDEVKDRVDRRVDQRVCQLVDSPACTPPPPSFRGRGGD